MRTRCLIYLITASLECLTTISALAAQEFESSPLPILAIDLAAAEIPDEPKARAEMRLVYNGPGVRNRMEGPTEAYVGGVAIERRGSSSQLGAKVSYGIELRASDGQDTSAALLGMPAEEDWVLHGPYYDMSLLRNAFTYAVARGLSTYAPRARYVELVLGGEYAGLYLLTESVKRDGHRVDVAKLTAADTSGEALTGGYLLKIDKRTAELPGSDPSFTLPHQRRFASYGTTVTHHYPKPERILPQQRSYIRTWMVTFEAALASEDYDDPTDGYAKWIDVESFLDFLYVNELTRNIDAYVFSTYLYKERDREGGRLHMGPVWDFNFALGYANWNYGQEVEGWVFSNVLTEANRVEVPFWWERLWSARSFRTAAAARWTRLRASGAALSDERLGTLLDSLASEAGGEVAERNFTRWNTLGTQTHADQVEAVRTYLTARVAWMDTQFADITRDASAIGAARRLRLSPNPARASARLRPFGTALPPDSVEWYDALGRRVAVATLSAPATPGTYHWRARWADGHADAGVHVVQP